MKKPTLRLRQVFEGPTHFKVVKPLGNPIKIAKKGLSPNLMGRLRRFATAGEVTDPVDATGDERQIDFEQPATAPTIPFDGAPRERSLEEIEQSLAYLKALEMTQGADDVAQVKNIKASDVVQEPVIVPAAPAFNVSKTPRVRGFTSAEMMGPPAPAPTAPTMNLDQINAMIGEEMGKAAPDMNRLEQLDAEREKIAPSVAAPAAAPAAVVAPAEPAKPAAVAAAPAEKPVIVPVKTAATAATIEKLAPAEPGPFEKTLGNLGYTMAQYEVMSAPMKVAAQQAVRATIAAQTAADAEAKAAEAETDAFAKQQEALKIEADSLQASAKKARETQQKILDEYDYLKNPTSYLGSMSTLGQIGTAISLAAGAFASGMTGMPNFAQKIYDNAIEQDLQAQKRKADSLYQRLVQAGNSVNSAEDLVRAQLKLVGAAELSRRSAQIKLPLVKAQIDAKAASEALKATETLGRVAKDQASMAREAELRPYQVRKLKAETVIAEGTPARLKKEMDLRIENAERDREEDKQKRQDRLDAAKTKADEDRINRELTLGETNLELKDDKRAPLIRDNISYRAQALESLIKLERLLDKAGGDGYELWKPGSNTRGEAIAELNLAIENFSKGAGFARAISVAAKELISKAVQEPDSYKTLFKKIFADRDPAVGIRVLRREVARNFEEEIASQSRNTRPQIRAALESWYKTANEKIARDESQSVADEEL